MKVKDLILGKRYWYKTKQGNVFEGTYKHSYNGLFLTKLTKKPHWWVEDWIILTGKSSGIEEID